MALFTLLLVQDVVNRTGLLNAQLAGQAGQIKPQGRNVSKLGTGTPLTRSRLVFF